MEVKEQLETQIDSLKQRLEDLQAESNGRVSNDRRLHLDLVNQNRNFQSALNELQQVTLTIANRLRAFAATRPKGGRTVQIDKVESGPVIPSETGLREPFLTPDSLVAKLREIVIMNSKLTLIKFSDHEKVIQEISAKLGMFEQRVENQITDLRQFFRSGRVQQIDFLSKFANKISEEICRVESLALNQRTQNLLSRTEDQKYPSPELPSAQKTDYQKTEGMARQPVTMDQGHALQDLEARVTALESLRDSQSPVILQAEKLEELKTQVDQLSSGVAQKLEDRSIEIELIAMNSKFERRLTDVEQALIRELGEDTPGSLKHRLAEVELILEGDLSGLSVSENNVSIDPERAAKPPDLALLRIVQRLRLDLEDKIRGLEQKMASPGHSI